jgi:hypothetical protein
MAKKKAAKKKSSKKKPGKKKAGKKTTAKAAAVRGRMLTFKCSSGCDVDERNARIGRAFVVLATRRTAVHIHFLGNRSPFDPFELDFDVPADDAVVKFIADNADGEYEYEFSCDSCKSLHITTNPKMIVP